MTTRDELFDFLNSLTLPDGRSYGRSLDPFQIADFEAAASGISSLYWGRPRGASKTLDAAAYSLFHIATTPGARAYTFAMDIDQARLVRDSAAGFVRRSATLRELIEVQRNALVIKDTDARLEIWTSDSASSWGIRPSLLVCDELSQWMTSESEALFDSVSSATGKVAGCQLIVATTAGWNRNSLCWRIRELARESDEWYYNETGQVASWISPKFLERQKELLPDHVFKMVHLNQWVQSGAEWLTFDEIDSVFVEGLKEHTGGGGPSTPGGRIAYFFGLDLATSRDRSALAVIRSEASIITVEKIVTWQGTPVERVSLAEVEQYIVSLKESFRPKDVTLDPWQGLLMSERLQAAGLSTNEYAFTQASRAALFDTLLLLIREHRLRSYDHPTFRAELNNLRYVERNGQLRVDHRAGEHDDCVVAVALASTRAVAMGIKPKSGVSARRVGDRSGGTQVARGMREGLGV